jgi:hypothetical protein
MNRLAVAQAEKGSIPPNLGSMQVIDSSFLE